MDIVKEKPIRVLQIVTNMSYGGLENLLMNYYRNIDREKVQFDFLTHVSICQDFEEEIKKLGGKIFRLPRLNPFSFSYRRKLNNFFCAHPEYKVVHCHLDCMAGIPLQAAEKNNVNVKIAHSHSSRQNYNLKYPVKLFFKRNIPQYATNMFACGQEAGEWMFGKKQFEIMRNAIDAQQFRYSEELSKKIKCEMGLQDNFVIGHVGQFRKEKNHLFLIEIFAHVLEKDSRCRLMLVGKGDQMQAVKDKAEKLKISDKILFLGARQDISDLMQSMDIFILPSLYEGLPVTVVEAQAAGLPCIISDRVPIECKITETVEQVSLNDKPEEWAKKLLKYKSCMRQDTYKSIEQAGFDIKTNAKWLEEFYCNAYRQG